MTRVRQFQIGAVLCLALFVLTAIMVAAGMTQAMDQTVLDALRVAKQPGQPSFPTWLLGLCRGITRWGAAGYRLPVALLCGLVLIVAARRREGALFMLSAASGALLSPLAKLMFGRARPDPVWRLAEVNALSFPSAHAMGAMIVFPMAGFLLGRLARGPIGGRIGLAAGIAIALTIGATRVLLGVHWLSDVIGGWLIGGAWTCASLALIVRGEPGAGGSEDRVAPRAAHRPGELTRTI